MKTVTWVKMLVAGTATVVGGSSLVIWLTPTEEELFMRYNPELQRRALETRAERQEDFNQFVAKLKQYSKSDKPIWVEWEQQAAKNRQLGIQAEIEKRREEEAAAEARRVEVKKSLR